MFGAPPAAEIRVYAAAGRLGGSKGAKTCVYGALVLLGGGLGGPGGAGGAGQGAELGRRERVESADSIALWAPFCRKSHHSSHFGPKTPPRVIGGRLCIGRDSV